MMIHHKQHRFKKRLLKLNPSCGAILIITVYSKCYLMHTWQCALDNTYLVVVTGWFCVMNLMPAEGPRPKCCVSNNLGADSV